MAVRTPLTINMASIPVKGAGGLAMLGMVLLIAAAIPAARWLLIGSFIAGAIAATLFILRHRDHTIGSSDHGLPMALGLTEDVAKGDRADAEPAGWLPQWAAGC